MDSRSVLHVPSNVHVFTGLSGRVIPMHKHPKRVILFLSTLPWIVHAVFSKAEVDWQCCRETWPAPNLLCNMYTYVKRNMYVYIVRALARWIN